MISKQAEAFWALLKSFPKQVEMPLAQARAADRCVEYFTSEPSGVAYSPAPGVDGFWAAIEGESSARTILYFFGGGYMDFSAVVLKKDVAQPRWNLGGRFKGRVRGDDMK